MTSPLAKAIDESVRLRVQEVAHHVRMDAPAELTFDDLPLKPVSASRTTHLTVVVQRIQDAKLPLPKLPAIAEKLSKGDFITMGPQCGLAAKLEDIQSYQIVCLPKENGFDLLKLVRFKLRTSVARILAAFYSDTYMVDISLLSGRNKTPVVMQKMFMGLGGNQVNLN